MFLRHDDAESKTALDSIQVRPARLVASPLEPMV